MKRKLSTVPLVSAAVLSGLFLYGGNVQADTTNSTTDTSSVTATANKQTAIDTNQTVDQSASVDNTEDVDGATDESDTDTNVPQNTESDDNSSEETQDTDDSDTDMLENSSDEDEDLLDDEDDEDTNSQKASEQEIVEQEKVNDQIRDNYEKIINDADKANTWKEFTGSVESKPTGQNGTKIVVNRPKNNYSPLENNTIEENNTKTKYVFDEGSTSFSGFIHLGDDPDSEPNYLTPFGLDEGMAYPLTPEKLIENSGYKVTNQDKATIVRHDYLFDTDYVMDGANIVVSKDIDTGKVGLDKPDNNSKDEDAYKINVKLKVTEYAVVAPDGNSIVHKVTFTNMGSKTLYQQYFTLIDTAFNGYDAATLKADGKGGIYVTNQNLVYGIRALDNSTLRAVDYSVAKDYDDGNTTSDTEVPYEKENILEDVDTAIRVVGPAAILNPGGSSSIWYIETVYSLNKQTVSGKDVTKINDDRLNSARKSWLDYLNFMQGISETDSHESNVKYKFTRTASKILGNDYLQKTFDKVDKANEWRLKLEGKEEEKHINYKWSGVDKNGEAKYTIDKKEPLIWEGNYKGEFPNEYINMGDGIYKDTKRGLKLDVKKTGHEAKYHKFDKILGKTAHAIDEMSAWGNLFNIAQYRFAKDNAIDNAEKKSYKYLKSTTESVIKNPNQDVHKKMFNAKKVAHKELSKAKHKVNHQMRAQNKAAKSEVKSWITKKIDKKDVMGKSDLTKKITSVALSLVPNNDKYKNIKEVLKTIIPVAVAVLAVLTAIIDAIVNFLWTGEVCVSFGKMKWPSKPYKPLKEWDGINGIVKWRINRADAHIENTEKEIDSYADSIEKGESRSEYKTRKFKSFFNRKNG